MQQVHVTRKYQLTETEFKEAFGIASGEKLIRVSLEHMSNDVFNVLVETMEGPNVVRTTQKINDGGYAPRG